MPEETEIDPYPQDKYAARGEYSRRALNLARVEARQRGLFPKSKKRRTIDVRDRSGSAPGFSGARPDARDPQSAKSVLTHLLGAMGWNDDFAMAQVMQEWDTIVGAEVARHCRPVTFKDGLLVIQADSSAWQSQMRMLKNQLISRIHEDVGRSVVADVEVKGPATVSWTKGKRSVKWRGVRDTYG